MKIAALFSFNHSNIGVLFMSNFKNPWLIQRLDLTNETANKNGRRQKIDYRKIKKANYGKAPETYDGKAVENPDALKEVRSRFMTYDYMGAAEFEFGALPRCMWRMISVMDKGELIIQKIEFKYGQDKEVFWIFAVSKTSNEVAKAFIEYVCRSVITRGRCYGLTKETLGFDQVLFPSVKRADGSSIERESWYNRNDVDTFGWLDIDNDWIAIWDRPDIAQAFANMHGLGDVLALDAHSTVIGSFNDTPNRMDYWSELKKRLAVNS